MNNLTTTNKTTFNGLKKYAWIFTLLVAFGGLWLPKLGLLVFGVIFSLTAMSLARGRFWCGNYCAHGSLFDQLLMPFSRNTKFPGVLRSRYTQAVVFLLFMYNLILKFVRVSSLWGTMPFWDRLGSVFVGSYLMVTIVGGLLGVIISTRTWCQVCPMGMMQTLTYRLGKVLRLTATSDKKVTILDSAKCVNCAKCARVCPMQLSPYTEFSTTSQFDNENCIRCSVCVESCPLKLLTLSAESQAEELAIRRRDNQRSSASD